MPRSIAPRFLALLRGTTLLRTRTSTRMPLMNRKPYVVFPCSPSLYVDHQRQASAEVQAASRRWTLSHPRHELASVAVCISATHSTKTFGELRHLCGSLHGPLAEIELGTGLLQHSNARSRVQALLGGLQPAHLQLPEPEWSTSSPDIGLDPESVLPQLEAPLLPPDKVPLGAFLPLRSRTSPISDSAVCFG